MEKIHSVGRTGAPSDGFVQQNQQIKVFLKGYAFNFPCLFHLVDDQGDQGKIKSSGRGIKMEGQWGFIFKMKMELEFIQVNLDGRV